MSRREDYKGFAAGMLSGVAKMSGKPRPPPRAVPATIAR